MLCLYTRLRPLFPHAPLRPQRSAPSARPRHWRGRRSPYSDAGMSTAEYAVGTLAAVAFAGVLYAVVSSSATRSLISSVVQRALTVTF